MTEKKPPAVRPRRDMVAVAVDVIPSLDTAKFDHMQRIALGMARTQLIPDTLCKEGDKFLPEETVVARCFMIVNQAVRWGMDPFSVAQHTSVVKGRLLYEGKLVAAVLDAKLGIDLDYIFNEAQGLDYGVSVQGWKNNRLRTIEGTVGQWQTTRNNSPWSNPANHKRMLIYRGTREWARLYASALMLGVYTPDEMDDMAERSPSPPTLLGSGLINRLQTDGSEGFTNAKQIMDEMHGRNGDNDNTDLPQLTEEENQALADLTKELRKAKTELDAGACANVFKPTFERLSEAARMEAEDRVQNRIAAINKKAP